MPPEIVARLNREIVKGLNAPDVLPKLEDLGYAVIGGPPEQFAALIPDGIERFGAIIKAAGHSSRSRVTGIARRSCPDWAI